MSEKQNDKELTVMSSRLDRPKGVSVLAWFDVVGGAVLLLASLGGSTAPQRVGFFVGGAFSLAAGIGLLQMRRWARHLAIAGYVLNILVGIAHANLIATAVSVLALAYLCSAQVKSAFASRASSVPPAAAIPGSTTTERAA